jgi:hypothetical protein
LQVSIRALVGVNSDSIRAIKFILEKPGLGIQKVCVLCGGPDWPTSVLTGILGLPLSQMLLGTLPIFVVIGPCVCAGAFQLRKSEGEVFTSLATVSVMGATIVQLMALLAACYFIERTAEENKEALRLLPKDQEVAMMDKTNRQKAQLYRSIIDWRREDFPWWVRLLLLFGAFCMGMSCYVFTLLGASCFAPFDVTSTIDCPPPLTEEALAADTDPSKQNCLHGNALNIVKPLGVYCIAAFSVGCTVLWVYSRWASKRVKAAHLALMDDTNTAEEEQRTLTDSKKEEEGSKSLLVNPYTQENYRRSSLKSTVLPQSNANPPCYYNLQPEILSRVACADKLFVQRAADGVATEAVLAEVFELDQRSRAMVGAWAPVASERWVVAFTYSSPAGSTAAGGGASAGAGAGALVIAADTAAAPDALEVQILLTRVPNAKMGGGGGSGDGRWQKHPSAFHSAPPTKSTKEQPERPKSVKVFDHASYEHKEASIATNIKRLGSGVEGAAADDADGAGVALESISPREAAEQRRSWQMTAKNSGGTKRKVHDVSPKQDADQRRFWQMEAMATREEEAGADEEAGVACILIGLPLASGSSSSNGPSALTTRVSSSAQACPPSFLQALLKRADDHAAEVKSAARRYSSRGKGGEQGKTIQRESSANLRRQASMGSMQSWEGVHKGRASSPHYFEREVNATEEEEREAERARVLAEGAADAGGAEVELVVVNGDADTGNKVSPGGNDNAAGAKVASALFGGGLVQQQPSVSPAGNAKELEVATVAPRSPALRSSISSPAALEHTKVMV